jgi:hypothetical protein
MVQTVANRLLPAILHFIPLAAWISGVGAGAGARRIGESLGSYDREQGNINGNFEPLANRGESSRRISPQSAINAHFMRLSCHHPQYFL